MTGINLLAGVGLEQNLLEFISTLNWSLTQLHIRFWPFGLRKPLEIQRRGFISARRKLIPGLFRQKPVFTMVESE